MRFRPRFLCYGGAEGCSSGSPLPPPTKREAVATHIELDSLFYIEIVDSLLSWSVLNNLDGYRVVRCTALLVVVCDTYINIVVVL